MSSEKSEPADSNIDINISNPDGNELQEVIEIDNTNDALSASASTYAYASVSIYAATVRHKYLAESQSTGARTGTELLSRSRIRSRKRQSASASEKPTPSPPGTYARYYRNEIDIPESGLNSATNLNGGKGEAEDKDENEDVPFQENAKDDEDKYDLDQIDINGDDDDNQDQDHEEMNEVSRKNESTSNYLSDDEDQEEEEDTFVNVSRFDSVYIPSQKSLLEQARDGIGSQGGAGASTDKSSSPNPLDPSRRLSDLMSAFSTKLKPTDMKKTSMNEHNPSKSTRNNMLVPPISKESRIDDVINGVPAKFIKNADAGLLSLLSANTRTDIDADADADGDGDTILEETSMSTEYVNIPDPEEKKLHLLKVLLGADYSMDGGVEEKEQEIETDQMLLPTESRNVDENVDDSDDDVDVDPRSLLPTLPPDITDNTEDTNGRVIQYLLDLLQEERKDENVHGAWWMDELQAQGAPEELDDISKLDTGDSSTDARDENQVNEETNSPDSQEDDIDDSSEFEDIDWDERLWEVARLHYHKAYPDADNMDSPEVFDQIDSTHDQVSEFRSLMITCLAVYSNVIHELSKNISSVQDKGSGLPEYVPIDVVTMLFEQVTRDFYAKHRAVDSKESVKGVQLKGRHGPETYAAVLVDALMGNHLDCFYHFEVVVFRKSGKSAPQLQDRKRVKQEDNTDRALVDEFLYGIDSVNNANNASCKVKIQDKGKAEILYKIPDEDLEREVKIRDSILVYLIQHSPKFFNEASPGDHMAKVLLGLIKEEGKKGLEFVNNSTKDNSDPIAYPESPVSFSTVYAYKHVAKFLVGSYIEKLKNNYDANDSDNDSAIRSNRGETVQEILLDARYIRQRFHFFGSFIATKDHVHDWLSLMALLRLNLPRTVSSDKMYTDGNSRETYSMILQALVTELIYALDEIFMNMKALEEETQSDVQDLSKVDKESQKSHLINLLDNIYRFLEIGKSTYQLGLDLGKSEKSHVEVVQVDGLPTKDISNLEMSCYLTAERSFRGAVDALLSCKRTVAIVNVHVLPGEPTLFSLYNDTINDLCISRDLHLADTLVAMGYSYDIKFEDHEKSISKYREALKLYRHLGSAHSVVIDALQNLGSVHFEGGDLSDALKCYKYRLRLLHKQEKDVMKNANAPQSAILKIREETCFTIQNIARVYVQLGNEEAASVEYSRSIERMRDVGKIRRSHNKTIASPNSFLEESLCELSRLFADKAFNLFTSWTEVSLTVLFGPIQETILKSNDIQYGMALDAEKKALHCLEESLHLRLGLEEYAGNGDYNFSLLSRHAALLPQEELIQFQSDLIRCGQLRFNQRDYKEAELEYFSVVNTILLQLDDAQYFVEEPSFSQMLEKITLAFSSDTSKYEILVPVLFRLGVLCTRRRSLDDSMSIFELCLQLCTDRLFGNDTADVEKLGIQLDLADVHKSMGFIYLRKGEHKLAASNLRTASRLLDGIINEPSEDMDSDIDEFVLEVHVKVSIVIVLNLLGQVYEEKDETLEKGLICFEDSMIILEDVLDEFRQDGSLFKQMYLISRIANGSVLQQPFSVLSLGRILGDNYYRGGKIYEQKSLFVDAELAYHRSINIFDILKDEQYSICDDGSIEDHDTTNLHRALLGASEKALNLLQKRNSRMKKQYITEKSETDLHFDDDDNDDLIYSDEDLLFRIGNCLGELGDFQDALKFLEKARKMTAVALGTNNFIIASILHNIGSVHRSIFFRTADKEARFDSIYAFEEAIRIIQGCKGEHELFLADLTYGVVEMKMAQCGMSASEANSFANDDALVHYLESVLRIRVQYHGNLHADVALTRYLLGKCYYYRHNTRMSLEHFDLALSQWQSLSIAANHDVFDALYFRGLCHHRLALSVDNAQLRKRELGHVVRYFLQTIQYSKKVYLNASSAIHSNSAPLRKTCVVHTVRCTLELILIDREDGVNRQILARQMEILSIIYQIMESTDDNEYLGDTFLQGLAAQTWLQIAFTNKQLGQRGAVILATKAAYETYTSLTEDDSAYLLDKTISTLMLARELMANAQIKKSLELWRESSGGIEVVCGKNTAEMAAISVYVGALCKSYKSPKYFERVFKIYDSLQYQALDPISTDTSTGQKGILYKELSMKYFMGGKYRKAMKTISIATSIIEQMQQCPQGAFYALPGSIGGAFFQIEDWDIILLECYVLNLQIASFLFQSSDINCHSANIVNSIGLLLGEIESTNESFQCFYSLLLHSRHAYGDNDPKNANILFNMSNISRRYILRVDCTLLYEEFYRISSYFLGNDLTLLPCVLVLCEETYQSAQYQKSMKWADIGLSSLRETNLYESEAAKLIAMKGKALIKFGKFSSGKKLLETALKGIKSRCLPVSDLHNVLGQIYCEEDNPTGAKKQFYECLNIRESQGDTQCIADIYCTIGEFLDDRKLHDESKNYYIHALRSTTDQYGCDHICVADCLRGTGLLSEAEDGLKYLREALRIYRLNENHEKVAHALVDLANISEEDVAQTYYLEALGILNPDSDILLRSEILRGVASICYRCQDYNSAANYFKQELSFVQQIDGLKSNIGESLYWYGCTSFHLGHYESSRRSLRVALKHLVKGNDKGSNVAIIIRAKLAQGRNYIALEKTREASSCVNEATKLMRTWKKQSSVDDLFHFYMWSGHILRSLKNVERSIANTKKALNIIENGKDEKHLIDTVNARRQIIGLHCEVGEYDIARGHVLKLIDTMISEVEKNRMMLSLAFEVCGDIELQLDRRKEAIVSYEKAIDLRDKSALDDCEVMLKLAKCLRRTNCLQNALEKLFQVEDIARFFPDSRIFLTRVHLERAKVFSEQERSDKASVIYHSIVGNIDYPEHENLVRLELSSIELADVYIEIASSILHKVKYSLCMRYLGKSVDLFLSDQVHVEDKVLQKEVSLRLIEVHEVLLERFQKYPGSYKDAISSLQMQLGNIFIREKKFLRALLIFEEVLRFQNQASCQKALTTILHNVGTCYFELGHIEKAVLILEKALQLGRELLGQNHTDVADTVFILAKAYEISSDIGASMSSIQTALKIRMAVYSMESSEVLHTLHAMGMLFITADRTDGAIKVCQDALRVQKRFEIDSNHHLSNRTHYLIALGFLSNKHLELALKHFNIYIKSPYKRSCELQIDIASAFYQIGKIHQIRGHKSKASKYFDKSLTEILLQLGIALKEKSKTKQTSRHSCLLRAKENLHCQSLRFTDLVILYGILLKESYHYKDSLECLDFAHELLSRILKPTSLRIGDVLLEKGRVLFELQQFSKASFVLEKALTLRRNVFNESSEKVIEVTRILGICESELGHTDKSLSLLRQTVTMGNKTLKNRSQGESLLEMKTLLVVGKLHHEKNQFGPALDLYRRCASHFKSIRGEKPTQEAILEIAILVATGNTYKQKACPFRALVCFEQAQFEGSKGGHSFLVAESLSSMGGLYGDLARYDDAIQSYTQCLRLQQEHEGNDHESTAQTLISLGAIYALQNKYDRSKKAYNQAINILKKCYGNYKDVGICWLKLGNVFLKEKCPAKALQCFQQGLDIIKSIDANDVSIWDAYYGLGLSYVRQNRPIDAISALSKACTISSILDDFKKSESLIHLAFAQFSMEDEDTALKNFEDAIKIKLSRLNDAVEAENCHKAIIIVLEILRKKDGALNLRYAKMMEQKGTCLARMDNHSDALISYAEALKIFKSVHGSFHLSVKNVLLDIGVCYNSLGKGSKARKCLQEASKITKHFYGDDHIDLVDIQFQKGVSYRIEMKFNEAIKCFNNCISLRRIHCENSVQLAELFEMVGDTVLNSKTTMSESAEVAGKNYNESLRLYSSLNCHHEMASLYQKLANISMMTRKYTTAITQFEKCLVTTKVLNGSSCESVADMYYNLGVVHDRTRCFSKAITCFDFCISINMASSSTNALLYKSRVLSKIGKFDEALDILSLLLDKDGFNNDLKLHADVLIAKANTYDLMNKKDMAMESYLLALSALRKLPNNEDSISNACHDIANKYLRKKNFDIALKFASEAFDIRMKRLGISNYLTVESLYCKGSILFGSNEWEQSLSCLELALFTFKELGSGNFHEANALYMIGCTLEKLGRYDEATQYMKEALDLHRKKDDQNIDLGRVLRRLGVLYKSNREYAQSRLYLKESLHISVTSLGQNHNEVAQVYEYIAETFCRESRYDEGIYNIGKAINIHERQIPSLDLARCYGFKGLITDQAGHDLSTTIDCYEKSNEIYSSLLHSTVHEPGMENHNMTSASIVFKLAVAEERNGKHESAVKHYTLASQLYKRVLKSNETLYNADILEKLANLKGREKKYDKASVLLEETLRIRIKILGMENKSVALALFSLGILFSQKNEYDAALKIFTDCLLIQKQCIGSASPQTADTLHAIGQCIANNGDYLNAVSIWNEAYEIYVKDEGCAAKLKALKYDLDTGYKKLHKQNSI